jgi:hypothetical protein
MAAPAPRCITLDVSALPPDVLTIDALARLELAARRGGLRFRLRDASDQLRDLIAFVGLSDVLGTCAGIASDALGTCAADGERIDRSVQTDARAKPIRPDADNASDALETCAADGERIDRSVQTDARAKPVRPDAGIASDALGVEPRRQAEQGEERVGVEEERELDDPAV